MLAALSAASPGWLVLAAGVEVVRIGLLPLVHRASARAVGHRIRYRQALKVALAMFTVTQTVPAGGAVAESSGRGV